MSDLAEHIRQKEKSQKLANNPESSRSADSSRSASPRKKLFDFDNCNASVVKGGAGGGDSGDSGDGGDSGDCGNGGNEDNGGIGDEGGDGGSSGRGGAVKADAAEALPRPAENAATEVSQLAVAGRGAPAGGDLERLVAEPLARMAAEFRFIREAQTRQAAELRLLTKRVEGLSVNMLTRADLVALQMKSQ